MNVEQDFHTFELKISKILFQTLIGTALWYQHIFDYCKNRYRGTASFALKLQKRLTTNDFSGLLVEVCTSGQFFFHLVHFVVLNVLKASLFLIAISCKIMATGKRPHIIF